MMRTFLVFVIGATFSAAIFVAFVIPSVRANWHAQGYNDGIISAQWDISEKLGKEFSEKPESCVNERTLFAVKTTEVHVSDCPLGKQVSVVK